jgi:hypothetical protein
MLRHEVINNLIQKYAYSRYLEIGSLNGDNVGQIRCEIKQSIDPMAHWHGGTPGFEPTFKFTSDEFFANEKFLNLTWDIIFIDGDHEREQVKRDIENSLSRLNPGGTIVCHDMCPPTEQHLEPRYCNNSWEAFAHYRKTNKNLEMLTVDTDCGCGIIRRGIQEIYSKEIKSDWEFFSKNKKEILNLISIEEFEDLVKEG